MKNREAIILKKKRRKKPIVEITDIVLPEEVKARLEYQPENKYSKFRVSSLTREYLLKKHCGFCPCGDIATKKRTFQRAGIIVIERFCNKCFEKHERYFTK